MVVAEGDTEIFCPNCGHAVHHGDQFCARCGFTLNAPPPAAVNAAAPPPVSGAVPVAQEPRGKNVWPFLLAPVLIILIAFIAFKVLSGFPYNRRAKVTTTSSSSSTQVGSGTIEESTSTVDPDLIQTAPPGTTLQVQPAAPPMRPTAPAPMTPQPNVTPMEPPLGVTPAEPPATRELSEAQALDRVLTYVAKTHYYDADGSCVRAHSLGYRNRGYTIELLGVDCADRDDGLLDRWRVDTVTGDVFKQSEDGRYLRP